MFGSVGPYLPTHAEFRWTESTPREWGCSVSHQGHMQIRGVRHDSFGSLDYPLRLGHYSADSKGCFWSAEIRSKFMRGVLRPIVATDNFWNTMPCKDCFHGCNHSCRGGCGQPGHLRISRKTVRRKWAPSFSKRSVPTTCHGYSGSSVVNSGAFLGRAFLAQVGHAVLYHLFQLTCDPRPPH